MFSFLRSIACRSAATDSLDCNSFRLLTWDIDRKHKHKCANRSNLWALRPIKASRRLEWKYRLCADSMESFFSVFIFSHLSMPYLPSRIDRPFSIFDISAVTHTFSFTLCCVLCTTKNKRRMERSCSASFSIYVSFGFVFAPSSWNLLNAGFLFWITIESKIDVLPMKKMKKRKKVGQTLYGEREWALRYKTNEANSIPTKLLWRIRFVSTTLLGSSFVSAAAAAAAFCIDTISNNSLFIIFDFGATRPCSFHLHKHKIDEVLASARKKTNKLRWNKLLMKPFFWFFFTTLKAKLIKYFVIDRSNACLNWGHPRKFALLLTSEMNLNRAKTTIFTHFAFALKARAAWNYSRNSL